MIMQLLYLSRVANVMAVEMPELVRHCRLVNADENLSGVIVLHRSRFLQILEGPQHRVLGAFERISRDKRHKAVVILSTRPVSAPEFGTDPMAHLAHGSPECDRVYEQVADILADANPNLRMEFESFAERIYA